MAGSSIDLAVATVYGLLGAALSLTYRVSPRLRDEPLFHGFTAAVTLAATFVVTATDFDALEWSLSRVGARFLLFFGASLLYAPAIVFLLLRYSEALLERILLPGSRKEAPRPPITKKEQWRRIQGCLEILAADPSNAGVREKLADIYAQLGFLESAVYEYRKAAEWLEQGYAHGLVLYKAARTIAERKKRVDHALPVLRTILRLYPRSYFAGYARRILNQHESRAGIPADT